MDDGNGASADMREQSFDIRRWVPAICLAGLSALFGYLLIYHYHHEGRDVGHLGDFPTFYQAAQIARAHGDIYTAGPPKQKYVYPPLIAVLYEPLTHLSRLAAARVTLVFTAAIVLLTLFAAAENIARRFSIRGAVSVLFVAVCVSVLNENELRNEFTMLETDALMLLMFTLALCWLDRLPLLAGLALAFAFNIKYLPIVVLPYLLLRRRWTVAGAMAAGSVLFALLPAIALGWDENLRCLHVSFGGLLKWLHMAPASGDAIEVHDIGDTLSLSITSALARVLTPRGYGDLHVMLAASGVGAIAVAVVAAFYRINRLSLFKSPTVERRTQLPFSGLTALEWAGLVTVALVFSPDTNTRHLILMMLVNITGVLVAMMPTAVSRGPAIVGLAVILASSIMLPPSLRPVYFRYGLPCWGLLFGYFLILWSGLRNLAPTVLATAAPRRDAAAVG